MSTERKPIITVAVFGVSEVGKTTFIDTLGNGTNGSARCAMQKVVEFAEVKMLFRESEYRAGHSDQITMEGVNGIILMYDIGRWSTFVALLNTICCLEEEIREKHVMLVGSKLDCTGVAPRKVSRRNGYALARDLGAIFFEVNARHRADVKEAMEFMANTVLYGATEDRRRVEDHSAHVGHRTPPRIEVSLLGRDTQSRFLTTDLQDMTSMQRVHEHIKRLFPRLEGKSFKIAFKGPSGENIPISCDAELAVALSRADRFQPLISVTEEQQRQPEPQRQSGTSPNNAILHPGVFCDMCSKSLYGIRYKCLQCRDYDMCGTCYAKKSHMEHDILILVKPAETTDEPISLCTDPSFIEVIQSSRDAFLSLHALAVEGEKRKPRNRRSHPAITCDICQTTPIHGPRYKCLRCDDFDMCEPCYGKNTHKGHDLLKLVNPRVAPRLRGLRGVKT